MHIVWNEAHQKLLVSLAARGLSAAEIGQALGFTRNAVIGRCFRTGVKLLRTHRGPDLTVRKSRRHYEKRA